MKLSAAPFEAHALVLGIDGGSTAFGWALLSVTDSFARPEPRYVDAGHDTASRENVGALLDRLVPGRDLVAIEAVVGGLFNRAGRRAAPAKHLFATASFSGHVRGLAEARGLDVVEVPAATWRRALLGRLPRKGQADAAVRRAIPYFVAGWPKVSNAHERDAAGAAVVGLRMRRRKVA